MEVSVMEVSIMEFCLIKASLKQKRP